MDPPNRRPRRKWPGWRARRAPWRADGPARRAMNRLGRAIALVVAAAVVVSLLLQWGCPPRPPTDEEADLSRKFPIRGVRN